MKPSIEKMLNKPYNEAVEEIEQKIANAVNNNKSIKTILNKGILEYIINNSDEKNPVTILNIRKAIDSKYNRNISNAVTNTLQAKLSG
ncbi:MAG: hypothetical protein U9O53_03780, partial [archaeon]|nr:hypothetical protein [archaeon]